MVREDGGDLVIDNGRFVAVIPKSSGMLESVRLSGSTFELAADYGDHSLFFPEFAVLHPDPSSWDAWSNPKGKYLGGRVTTEVAVDREDIAVVRVNWETGYQDVRWEYRFVRNRPYLSVYTERTIRTTNVYVNAQQCVMFTADMDDSYIVNYEGELVPTMLDGWPVASGVTIMQHSLFSAMDEGLGVRYPALVWHDDETNTVAGVLVSYVTPNQRESISYHGGGRSKVRHPGYAEGQWNWFGKSDNESLYLREGTRYGMEMYYYFGPGDVDDFDAFNRGLFNGRHYDIRSSEDYWAASWGGRRVYGARYSWSYPQATNNYISSQELFRPRAISLPRSQNGTLDPQIFDLWVMARTKGRNVDLAPLPREDGGPLLHKRARTVEGEGYMAGEVTWEVGGLENTLRYKILEDSDKLIVGGRISTLAEVPVEDLFVELRFSPRVREAPRIGQSAWDIRCDDTIYNTLGIAVYDPVGIDTIVHTGRALRLYIVEDDADILYPPVTSWEYEFVLFPHLGHDVETPSQITPLHTKPERTYREYYKALPGLEDRKRFGICPDPNVFAYAASLEPDVLRVELYTAPGTYPVRLFLEGREVSGVRRDGIDLPRASTLRDPLKAAGLGRLVQDGFEEGSWEFDREAEVLQVEAPWSGPTTLEVLLKGQAVEEDLRALPRSPGLLTNFPNPFNRSTVVRFAMPSPAEVDLSVYDPSGRRVRTLVGGRFGPGFHRVHWDGRDDRGDPVGSGVYLIRLEVGGKVYTRKAVLVR